MGQQRPDLWIPCAATHAKLAAVVAVVAVEVVISPQHLSLKPTCTAIYTFETFEGTMHFCFGPSARKKKEVDPRTRDRFWHNSHAASRDWRLRADGIQRVQQSLGGWEAEAMALVAGLGGSARRRHQLPTRGHPP